MNLFERYGINLHEILNPIRCSWCDGNGIRTVHEDFEKPYETCKQCDGHGYFTGRGRKFSIIPAFDDIKKVYSKDHNGNQVIRYNYIYKGKIVGSLTQEEYEREVING